MTTTEDKFSSVVPVSRAPYLLYVGVWSPKKNLQGLLAAWPAIKARFNDASLVVRSSGVPADVCKNLKNVIIIDSYLEEFELWKLISHATALVMPSFHEGFGLPALEAMAVGTPVCVSKGTALEEIVGGAGYVFDPSSTTSIAEACCSALALGSSELDDVSRKCIDRASQYSANSIIPQLLSLMTKVIG